MRDQIKSSVRRKKKGCAEEAEALCLPGETAAGLKRGECLKTFLKSSSGASKDINILAA